MVIRFLILLLSLIPAMSSAGDRQQVIEIEKVVETTVRSHYLIYFPDGYEESDELWPLLFFLHGSGERGADLALLKTHGPPKHLARGEKMPMIVVSPQCPEDERWPLSLLNAVLDEVLERHRVDRSRIYLTGLSMGGQGVWKLATARPDLFAALVPICGRSYPDRACAIKDLPVWIFHGAKDRVVPLEESERMAEALRACGAEPRLTVFPDGQHDVWSETYSNPNLYRWLSEQRRTD